MVEINIRNGCCESALRFIGSQNIESCLSESRGQYPGSYAEKNPFDHSVPENHLFNNCAVPVSIFAMQERDFANWLDVFTGLFTGCGLSRSYVWCAGFTLCLRSLLWSMSDMLRDFALVSTC